MSVCVCVCVCGRVCACFCCLYGNNYGTHFVLYQQYFVGSRLKLKTLNIFWAYTHSKVKQKLHETLKGYTGIFLSATSCHLETK